MSSKFTILFAPLSGFGHVNACLGIAQVLQKRGHTVVFAVSDGWKKVMKDEGFDAEFYVESQNDPTFWPKFMNENGYALRLSPIEQYKVLCVNGFSIMADAAMNIEDNYRHIINKVKPDIIIIDSHICSPALTNSGPWVRLISPAPLFAIPDERTPPAFSGLAITSSKQEWDEFRAEAELAMMPLHEKVNDWVISLGAPPIPRYMLHPNSPYLNIYMYPKELDYHDLRPLPPEFHRFDNFMRNSREEFKIPEKLRNKKGKLIYVSMGSFANGDVSLMTRLVNILKEIPHRFIISMGDFLDQNQLGDNMWGEPMVPQINILPLMDLVITHGGTNTIVEIFAFGVPFITMPLFSDHNDNAQRIRETGFGIVLNPYTFTKEQLSNSIEKTLNDEGLRKRLINVSKRIELSKSKERAAELIENIIN